MATEKELNVNLMERLHVAQRIEKVARKDGATIEDVLEVIEEVKGEIMEMLYQKPPLIEN